MQKKPKIKMTIKDLEFLDQMFVCDHLNAMCKFWNGIQIGLVVGELFLIGAKMYWWMFGLFWIVTGISAYYIYKHKKAVDRLEELV